jgi:hypothetical protein
MGLSALRPRPPPRPQDFPYADDTRMTLVTALLDLGRGKGASGSFQRSIQVYITRLQSIIHCGFPMVVFMPVELAVMLKYDPGQVRISDFNITALKTYFPYW